jgi:hypothetical protein
LWRRGRIPTFHGSILHPFSPFQASLKRWNLTTHDVTTQNISTRRWKTWASEMLLCYLPQQYTASQPRRPRLEAIIKLYFRGFGVTNEFLVWWATLGIIVFIPLKCNITWILLESHTFESQ